MSDKMILKGMRFYGKHGYLAAEKRLGQWFEVDIELTFDLSKASKSDALEDTLNYVALYEVVKLVVQGPSLNLIEALAGRIMDSCFNFSRVEAVLVRVEKPQVPLGGPIDYTAVELNRSRQEWLEQKVKKEE